MSKVLRILGLKGKAAWLVLEEGVHSLASKNVYGFPELLFVRAQNSFGDDFLRHHVLGLLLHEEFSVGGDPIVHLAEL